jgi:hypothetical protein
MKLDTEIVLTYHVRNAAGSYLVEPSNEFGKWQPSALAQYSTPYDTRDLANEAGVRFGGWFEIVKLITTVTREYRTAKD